VGEGGSSDAPIDRLLDGAEATLSAGTRELCCLLNRDAASFERAAANLLRTTGTRVSAELLRRTVESEGRHVLACCDDGRLDPPSWASPSSSPPKQPQPQLQQQPQQPNRIYLGCDGFTGRLITAVEKSKRRALAQRKRRLLSKEGGGKGDSGGDSRPRRALPRPKRGADQSFKEFKLVTFYDESGDRRLVSITRDDHHAAGRLMRRDARRCGFFDADQRPAVVDGGPWIVNQIKRQSLPVTSLCLDFFHLAENVHRARGTCFGEAEPAGLDWAGGVLHAAKHEGYGPTLDALVAWRRTLRSPVKRRAADLLINYVTDRREMLDYPRLIALGLQIGSGPTESQCKQVPRRVKGRGKRWDADNAEAVMALEAMEQSALSRQYWKTCAAAAN
jgi:hypothetical protein